MPGTQVGREQGQREQRAERDEDLPSGRMCPSMVSSAFQASLCGGGSSGCRSSMKIEVPSGPATGPVVTALAPRADLLAADQDGQRAGAIRAGDRARETDCLARAAADGLDDVRRHGGRHVRARVGGWRQCGPCRV